MEASLIVVVMMDRHIDAGPAIAASMVDVITPQPYPDLPNLDARRCIESDVILSLGHSILRSRSWS